MKISLSIRPFAIDENGKFENNLWEEKGLLNLEDAIYSIESFNWKQATNDFKNAVLNNNELTIQQVIEPSFSLLNEETENELFVGLFENDLCDLTLAIPKEDGTDSTEINGLTFNQVKEMISLFYSDKLQKIKDFPQENLQAESEIKNLLINRTHEQFAKERKKSFRKIAFYLALLAVLFLILSIVR